MVAIQITAGTFGWNHDGRYDLVPAGAPPIEVDEATAERLVSKRVAELVSAAPISYEEPREDTQSDVQSDPEVTDIHDMTAKQLRELGEQMGLKFGVNARKADMIAAIEAEAQQSDDAPSFDASEAVQ